MPHSNACPLAERTKNPSKHRQPRQMVTPMLTAEGVNR
jgi:hypothetical protein